VPDLLAVLRDEAPFVRAAAATALGDVAVNDPEVLPALLEAVADPGAASAAVVALGKWTRLPMGTAPVLLGFFKRTSTVAGLLPVLGKLDRPTPQILTFLRRLLRGGRAAGYDYYELTQASLTLALFGPAAASAIPDLALAVRETTNPNPALALARLGPEGVAQLCELLPAVADQPRQMCVLAGLEVAGPAAAAAVPHLRALLTGEVTPWIRKMVIEALALVGPAGAAALPEIVLLVENKEYSDGVLMSAALRKFGAALLPFVPRLLGILHDEQRRVEHAWIIEVLGALADTAPELVGELRQALQRARPVGARPDPHREKARLAVVEAFQHAQGGHDEILPDLLPLLNDPVPQVRGAAATALGRLRVTTPEALAALQKATEDGDKAVRRQAGQALRKLQPRKK
jgi:HEAT repeat protein